MRQAQNLTPPHLRCSIGGCPCVYILEDGRLAIIAQLAGETDNIPEHIWEKRNADAGEALVVMWQDYFVDLPEILHLRLQVAKLKQALEPMHQFAAEIMMAHEAILAVWRGKASPEIIVRIEALREKLFTVSKIARAAITEEDKNA